MSPRFWQLLAAAEVPLAKGRAFLETLDPSALSELSHFSSTELLTKAESGRAIACGFEAIDAFVADGGYVLAEEELPLRLTALEDPPLAVFVDGNVIPLAEPCIGIVGTRNASVYGKAAAKKFAMVLAESGVTVVSGGALGIDSAAHDGALSGGGKTVAVLAGGVDKPYPTQNAGLFSRIRKNGCLVSTYACGTLPQPYKFLERNTVIAGLSDAVLVVEAPAQSGALSTAVAAKALGRPVFVIPANIEAKGFRGSHRLIREGAMLADSPEQILDALGILALSVQKVDTPATGLAAKILSALSTKPTDAEKLAVKVGVSPQDLLAELTMLELEGRVTRELGGYALAL